MFWNEWKINFQLVAILIFLVITDIVHNFEVFITDKDFWSCPKEGYADPSPLRIGQIFMQDSECAE